MPAAPWEEASACLRLHQRSATHQPLITTRPSRRSSRIAAGASPRTPCPTGAIPATSVLESPQLCLLAQCLLFMSPPRRSRRPFRLQSRLYMAMLTPPRTLTLPSTQPSRRCRPILDLPWPKVPLYLPPLPQEVRLVHHPQSARFCRAAATARSVPPPHLCEVAYRLPSAGRECPWAVLRVEATQASVRLTAPSARAALIFPPPLRMHRTLPQFQDQRPARVTVQVSRRSIILQAP